ncbi:hypothetical protein L7F22_022414 [Adiantum nelumboides]|nr:hypothetical protein [Adiantum nelumboides]
MLTEKEVPFLWGATEVTAFQTLKDKMITGSVLILPDLQKSFEVYCDACGRSLGAVLMQEDRVIVYESRLFSKPEMTAQIYEKELLEVIHALSQWRHYLLGADFNVFTDHQSLRYFLSQKQLLETQMRWANILSQLHFQIVYVQGQKNVVADALSRKPLVQAISAIHHSSFEDMVDQYATDTDFADIYTRIRDGETVAGYSIREGYMLRKTMLCVTQPLREKVMTESHCPPFTGHRGIATTIKGVERYFYWPRLKKDLEKFVPMFSNNAFQNKLVIQNKEIPQGAPDLGANLVSSRIQVHSSTCIPFPLLCLLKYRMDPAKIEASVSRPDLKTVHDVRSFVGLCSYYRRFVRHFAEIASPLHALEKKAIKRQWTSKEKSAFRYLKEKMTTDLVFVLPDLSKSFVVQCDACGNSIGAVLMQNGRVVAYESRILSDTEKTYQIYEKELLAVIHALSSWKHYLLGADFVVQTDHQTLRYFLTQAKLSEKHMRWANFLSMFHFQIVHVEGKKNVVADALSRKPQVSAVSISYHQELEDMKEQYANDEDISGIYEQLMSGQHHDHYILKDSFIMMHGKLCVTKQLRPKVLVESHAPPYAGHRGIDATVKAVTVKRHQGYCNRCQFQIRHGKVLPWISFLIVQEQQQGMMESGLSFADSASRHILSLLERR